MQKLKNIVFKNVRGVPYYIHVHVVQSFFYWPAETNFKKTSLIGLPYLRRIHATSQRLEKFVERRLRRLGRRRAELGLVDARLVIGNWDEV